jgi:hypothetical protein
MRTCWLAAPRSSRSRTIGAEHSAKSVIATDQKIRGFHSLRCDTSGCAIDLWPAYSLAEASYLPIRERRTTLQFKDSRQPGRRSITVRWKSPRFLLPRRPTSPDSLRKGSNADIGEALTSARAPSNGICGRCSPSLCSAHANNLMGSLADSVQTAIWQLPGRPAA